MAIIFQYGSNCSTSRLNSVERLNGAAAPISIAETVDDYELAFDVWSDGNGCAASDIVPMPGSKVWGVLYEIPDDRIRRETSPAGTRSLDAIEGEGRNYERRSLKVRRPDNTVIEAITYTVKLASRRNNIQTSLDYVEFIVQGLRQHGVEKVAEHYIPRVKAIASANNPAIAPEVGAL
jgi:gamma-glutamylcyclotransferase